MLRVVVAFDEGLLKTSGTSEARSEKGAVAG